MKTVGIFVLVVLSLGLAACGQMGSQQPEVTQTPLENQAIDVFLDNKLLASDGEADDRFGVSVSIDGDVALIGARRDDDNGLDSGAAYIFRKTTEGWVEEAKLLASDGEERDFFGVSVSIDGDVALIGVLGDDDNGGSSGAAYIFRKTTEGWVEEAKLLASDGEEGDFFGVSVSIDGDVALIGANHDVYASDYRGAAYIFRKTTEGWVEEAKLLASDGGVENEFFGTSVSIDSNVALIGAFGTESYGIYSGAAYIFRNTSEGWVEEAKLLASDGERDDYFGYSVSLDSGMALIGAYRNNDNGLDSGAAYIFRSTSEGWVEEAKLLASDGEEADYFGYSVSLDSGMALIGAYRNNDNGLDSGAAYFHTLPVTPPPTAGSCGGFFEASKKFSISWDDDTCTVRPDPCFWILCKLPPEIWLTPKQPCLKCSLELELPKYTRLNLTLTLPDYQGNLGTLNKMISLDIYNEKGKHLGQAKAKLQKLGKQKIYRLSFKSKLPAGNYELQISQDKDFAKQMQKSPLVLSLNNLK